jgi:hypothetical protein
LKTFIGSKIEWSRKTGYRCADKPYRANNTLLRIATIRRGTIELMQNAASTASAAKYPNTSIPDIAVEPLCASVISAQMLPLDLAIGCDGHHKNVDSQFRCELLHFSKLSRDAR